MRGLQELGWTVGRNMQIDFRSTAGEAGNVRKYAAEIVALAPDVILSAGDSLVGALQQATRSLPIVFAQVADAVGAGFVTSLARPGGNATGFTPFEYSFSGKWLERLKQIAPSVTQVAVVRDAAHSLWRTAEFGAIQAVAPSFGVEFQPFDMRDPGEIERGVAPNSPESRMAD